MNTTPCYSKFSLLPQLNKLTLPLFLPKLRREEKKEAQRNQLYFCEENMTDEIYDEVKHFIMYNHPLQYYLTYPMTYQSVCNEIYEDVLIHRRDKGKDWLASIHSSFPNGWLPERNIGKSFVELHSHIPGMRLDNAKQIVNTCINYGPFQRYVWGLFHDDRLNGHPSIPDTPFDPSNPKLFIRLETQITVGFPKYDFFLFLLRQEIIRDIDTSVLYNTYKSMTPEQLRYKRINQQILDYLEKNRASRS